MPNYTTNLNLVKPLVNEQYDIAKVTNDNADIIDDAIHDLDVSKVELPNVDKVTPIDADSLFLIDSEASNVVKKWTLENIKTLLQEKLVSGTNIKTINGNSVLGSGNLALEEIIVVALSDESTALTAGTTKATFRMPFACKLTTRLPRASVNTASSSGLVTVDIKKNGTTIFSTLLTINVSSKTSVGATTPCVLSSNPTTFADDDEVTFDITVAGTGAKGLKVTLFVERT